MVNANLIRDLSRPDRYETAADALVALGASGVEQLVREVMDSESPVDWRPIASVLGRIGEAGFDGLLQGLLSASAEESRKRVGFAFSQLGAAVLDRYTAALAHPVPLVRRLAVRGIEHCGEAGRSVAVLLPLLGDPEQEVARQTQDTLCRIGEHMIPLLRRVRERGPGRQRARALTVLAELGGEPALSRADTAAIERLIRIKLPDDRPEPLWACWNYWMAVPGGDQAGIMRTLGLTDPRPVTFALGNDIVDADGHGGCDSDEHTGYERVFVTPELAGWTLVLGAWCDPHGQERREDVLRLCTKLSARYGRALAYYYGGQGDGSAWLVTEHGTVIRRYAETGEAEDELLTLGKPLPYERARRTELGLHPDWDPAQESKDDEDEWRWTAHDLAPDIARSLGAASPLDLTAATPSRGTGVIALTPYGVAHGIPAGAYRI